MPRRAPPTALRLVTGPTPSRYSQKHVLPSVPLPTFQAIPSSSLPPRQTIDRRARTTHAHLPPLNIPFAMSGGRSGNTSPVSATSMKAKIRGPWDHSGSIPLEFDVTSVLAPLKPVAVSPGSAGSWGAYI